MAANLAGSLWKTSRVTTSPRTIWAGVTTAATVNGIRNPTRWWRSRRPFSIPAAYTLATMNPATM